MQRSLTLLLSCATIAAAASCAPGRDAAPTAPRARMGQSTRGRPDATPADSIGALASDSAGVVATCEGHGPSFGVALVGPRGGTLMVGGVELVVPPGALDETVPISATLPPGNASEVHFEPQGLQFDLPVRLVLPGDRCALYGGTVMVDYIADDGTVLEHLPAHLDASTSAVSTQIRHFSIYAVAVRQGSAPQ